MNIAVWIVAGAIIGWAGIAFLGFNAERGRLASIAIGTVGGLVGGQVLAPMFTAVAANPGGFNVSALMFAAGTSAALLAAGNLIQNRWGV